MLLPHRAFADGAPRRTWASSMTSSWYSVARCTSSMTAPATVTCQSSGSGPTVARSTVNSGRNRLPPASNRCSTASVISVVAAAQFGGDQVLHPGDAVAHTLGEIRVAEVHPRHHGRRCPHPANILVRSMHLFHLRSVVVGAGPSGSAAAAWAARPGREVLVIDAGEFPRDKACGDGLTPGRSPSCALLGLGDWLDGRIRHHGLRLAGFGSGVEVRWPGPSFPPVSSAVPRTELDDRVRKAAEDAGAAMLLGCKAVDVQRDSAGRVTAVVLADGRRVGLPVADRGRRRPLPAGPGARPAMASADRLRGGRARPTCLAARRRAVDLLGPGTAVRPTVRCCPGYGWIFPLGNGEVNLGVGALATAKRPADVALRPLIRHYTDLKRDAWGFEGEPRAVSSALLPMGGAVSGVAGPNWMLIGRRRGLREPAQRRGHRLRPGDRTAGR